MNEVLILCSLLSKYWPLTGDLNLDDCREWPTLINCTKSMQEWNKNMRCKYENRIAPVNFNHSFWRAAKPVDF